MKKLFSILLSFAIVISLFPTTVFASESSKYEEIVAAACKAFPEYASKIVADASKNSTGTQACAPVSLVRCETRAVSTNREITYAEFTNGAVFLADNIFVPNVDPSSTNEGGGVVTTTCEIKVVCNYASKTTFKLSKFTYKMLASDYDYIVRKGTPSSENASNGEHCIYDETEYVQYETAAHGASLSYYLQFYDARRNCYDCDLDIKIAKNGFSCKVDPKV